MRVVIGILKLTEESQIIIVQSSDIGDFDVGAHHVGAFKAKAKGKTGVFFGVDLAGFEDVGMNHASAAKFVPALLAGAAFFA